MWKKIVTWGVLLVSLVAIHAQDKLVEQVIYVPRQDWKAVVHAENKGVQLTYADYQELLRRQPQPQEQPPVPVLVEGATYRGSVQQKSLSFTATVRLVSLSDTLVPYDFTLGQLGISRAQLDGQDVPLFSENTGQGYGVTHDNYRLFLSGKGEHILVLHCHANMTAEKDRLKAALRLGKFPSQAFFLDVDAQYTYITNPGHHLVENDTKLEVYLGSHDTLELEIRPKEKEDEKKALEIVELVSSHAIGIDSIRSRFAVEIQVYHKPLKTFELILPGDVDVLYISEPRWDLDKDPNNNRNTLTVQLDKELLGKHKIALHTERQMVADGTFELPKVVATGQSLLRQEGIVYIEKDKQIKLELEDAYLARQVDLQQVLHSSLHRFGHTFFSALRFWDANYKVQLAKSQIQPKVESVIVAALSVYPDTSEFKLSAHATFDVVEGEVKQLALRLPAQWKLTSAVELYAANSPTAQLARMPPPEHYVREGILYVPLQNKLLKGHSAKVSLTLEKLGEKWRQGWKKGAKSWRFPTVVPLNSRYMPSFLGIIADGDYDLKGLKLKDIDSIDLKLIRDLAISSDDLALGYKLTSAEASGQLRFTEKQSNVSVNAAHYIDIDAERLRYATTLVYNIKNSAVDRFRFFLPEAVRQLHISDDLKIIKENREPVASTEYKGYMLWEVVTQKKVIGNYSLYLTQEVPIRKQQDSYHYPQLLFDGVKQIQGVLAIQTSSRSEVTLFEDNLEAIRPQQVPVFAHPDFSPSKDFSYALKYTTPNYALRLDVGTHDAIDVTDAVITSAKIHTIFPGNDLERVECSYQLAHLKSQFFEVTLPENADFWSAVVDGQGEKPNLLGNSVAIPVKRHDAGANSVEIVYQRRITPLSGWGQLELKRPETKADIPVRVLHWEVSIPQEYRLGTDIRGLSRDERPWYQQLLGTLDFSRFRRMYKAQSDQYYASPSTAEEAPFQQSFPSGDAPATEYYRAPESSAKPEPLQPSPQNQPEDKRVANLELDRITQKKINTLRQLQQQLEQQKSREESKQKAGKRNDNSRLEQQQLLIEREIGRLQNKDRRKSEESRRHSRLRGNRPHRQQVQKEGYQNSQGPIELPATDPAPAEEKIADELGANEALEEEPTDFEGGEEDDNFGGFDMDPDGDDDTGKGSSAERDIVSQDQLNVFDLHETPDTTEKLPRIKGKLAATSVENVKAKGVRSIDIDLGRENTNYGSKGTPTSQLAVQVTYIHGDVLRSLHIALLALSAILGLVLLAQHRYNRPLAFFAALLVLTFLPRWFGVWLVPYTNALVWGLLLSLLLAGIYKVLRSCGQWLGLRHVAAVFALALLLHAGELAAQQKTRRIYVPYDPDKIQQDDVIRDVFVTYRDYVELWNNAYPDRQIEVTKQELRPDYVVYNALYDGKIVDGKVEFSGEMLVEVFKSPMRIAIGLANTSIQKSTLQPLEGQASPIAVEPDDKGYHIVIANSGTYKLRVEFLPQFQIAPKSGHFQFGIVPIATASMVFRLDKDTDAAFAEGQGSWFARDEDQHKIVTLYPSHRDTIDMRWFESSQRHQARGLNLLVDSRHQLLVGNNVLQLISAIQYSVISGEIDRLTLKVPNDYSVVRLDCTNLEQWTLAQEADYNLVTLRLVDASQRHLTVNLTAEKILAEGKQTYPFPEVIPVEANRETGRAILMHKDPYQLLVADREGVRKEKSFFRQGQFVEVFRYTEHPYTLDFTVSERDYKNFARSNMVLSISEEKLFVDYDTTLEVHGRRMFQHRLALPQGFEIKQVTGPQVANWRLDEAGEQKVLEIVFHKSVLKDQKTQMHIRLERDFEPGETFALPVLAASDVQYESGTILVTAINQLELATDDVKSLQEYDVAVFRSKSGYAKKFAYRFEGINYEANITARRKQPKISVKSAVNVLVEDDWINFAYFLSFSIDFAGTDSFSFVLPAKIGEKVDISGPNIREKQSQTSKDGKYIVWTVLLHSKVENSYELEVYPQTIKNTGAGVTCYPVFFDRDIQHQSFVLVQNNSQYEIVEQQIDGLTSVSPHQQGLFLPGATSPEDFIRAYKVNRSNWQLVFSENRQEVIHTVTSSIDAIRVDTVVDSSGECRHRVIYNITHSGLQFLELEKLPETTIWGTFVGGHFVRPVKRQSQDGKERILIPMHQVTRKKQRISVRLIYSQKQAPLSSSSEFSFHLPRVLNVEQIDSVLWNFYAPRGYLYKFSGNLSPGYIQFQEYGDTGQSTVWTISSELNVGNMKATLSTSNILQKRQKKWRKSQGESFSQYGAKNQRDMERAQRRNVSVYTDSNADRTAGKEDTEFIVEQNQLAQQSIAKKQQLLLQQRQVRFFFDIEIPGDQWQQSLVKKGGNAILEVYTYRDPHQSTFWITVQFLGLLSLIWLCARYQLFHFREYTWGKFFATIGVLVAAAFFCGFLNVVHYFYL